MTSAIVPYLVTGNPPERTGNIGYSGQPTSAVFNSSDGRQISLGVVQQAQFEALAREVDRKRWLEDARFLTPDLRRKHSAEMRAELDEVFGAAPAAQWETRLSAACIPCGMIRDVTEAVSLPALEARRLKLGLNVPGLPEREQVEIVNAGFLFSEDQPGVDSPPPRLGQHSDDILKSLGFTATEIQALHA
jgi:CoA:oxalate CoA-transferase